MNIRWMPQVMDLQELIRAHPMLQDVECGVAVPPGWVDLVHDLITKLEGIPGVVVTQVKSKFGTLRVYTKFDSADDAAVKRLVSDAEFRSSHTCEVCGAAGATIRTTYGGWHTTRCPEHNP